MKKAYLICPFSVISGVYIFQNIFTPMGRGNMAVGEKIKNEKKRKNGPKLPFFKIIG